MRSEANIHYKVGWEGIEIFRTNSLNAINRAHKYDKFNKKKKKECAQYCHFLNSAAIPTMWLMLSHSKLTLMKNRLNVVFDTCSKFFSVHSFNFSNVYSCQKLFHVYLGLYLFLIPFGTIIFFQRLVRYIPISWSCA